MCPERRVAHQRSGLIRWEEAEVVLEHRQLVDQEPAVSRIDVETIHLACGRCLVLQRLLQRTDLAKAETVGFAQAGQAVVAFDELVPQPGP